MQNSQPTLLTPTNNTGRDKKRNNNRNNTQVVIVGANERTNLANVIDKRW